MTSTAFDLALCALILAAAVAAVAGRGLFRATVFLIVYGVFVAIAWLRLGAADVALAEAAIGAGLTGFLLLGALARLPDGPPGRRMSPVEFATALAAAGLGGTLVAAFVALPKPAGLREAVEENLTAAGVENPVTAVLLNFRAWDTLLESVVLMTALLAVWSLSEDRAWGGRPGLRQHVRPGGVLASFGRALPPVGLLVGIYLVWVGSSRPGGAFQGGTVLAAVALLAAMAGLYEAPRLRSRRLRLAVVAGPAAFLAVALGGALAGRFLVLPTALAKPLILGTEAALAASIAVTLALLVLGRAERRG
jgi:multisubunit Na+/H+ antiporter MnhB subunit